MGIIEKKEIPPAAGLQVDLRFLEWAKGLSDETLRAIIDRAEWIAFTPGEVVVEVDSEITHVYFVVTGRLHMALYDLLGKEIISDILPRGAVIGLFAVGLSDRSHLQVEAVEPSTTIRLTLPDLLELTANHADFQLAMFRVAANLVAKRLMVDRSRPKPRVVGIFHYSDASRPLADRLARRLQELDESPCVAGDAEQWKPHPDIPFKLLPASDRREERRYILKVWAAQRRLLVDVRADQEPEVLIRLLNYLDIALWCIRPQDAREAVDTLQRLEKSVPGWRDKIRIVWLLDRNTPIPPYVPELHELAQRDFKLTLNGAGLNQGNLLQHGLERIVHHLRGIMIGLALGGGAARGMAHIGVLKALERHGIYIDALAGTSAGALTGTLYAAGLPPGYLTQIFKTNLRPPWLYRQMRAGGYWYLLRKYRRNEFDSMLREHLDRYRMEQLILPAFTISVDLVEGEPLVREVGDATTNILESINLPPLSLPIFASGQALVDGGLLNNVPADVLAGAGCNFVIASSVTAKLEKDFAGLRSKGQPHMSRFFSTIHVIMREKMIQGYRMNAVGVQPADFVIAPDVTAFDISEFSRADEMALVGESTADAAVAQLRKMLSRLDPKLFPSS